MRGDADATESRTSVPGLAGKDFREGNEASENRPDLLSFDQHQPNGTTARDADHVHNSGSIKDAKRRSGGCARKTVELTPGDLLCVAKATEVAERRPDRRAEVSRGHIRPCRR